MKEWKQQDTVTLLPQKTIELPTVIIQQKPYTRQGDTITFNVSAYDQKNLRSIGDVINNIPGFETGSNGAITYQGKPLSNYYIENLDLLGGRYPLANRQLPKEMVSQIQVFLRHQPIRMLDSLIKPNNVAINLKLKENAKGKLLPSLRSATGANTLGPLGELNFLLTYFSKKFQALSNAHYNNIGTLKEEELNGVVLAGNFFLQHFSGWNNPVTVTEALMPPLGSRVFSFNHSAATDVHVIKKTSEYGTLKWNSGYVYEHNRQQTALATTLFTGADTLHIIEINRLRNQLHAVKLGANYTYNAPRLYYTAEATYTGRLAANKWAETDGSFENRQALSAPENELQIKLNAYKTIKKWILNGGTLFVTNNVQSNLVVTPGMFPDYFNQGKPYSNFDYYVNYATLISKSILTAKRKLGKSEFTASLTNVTQQHRLSRIGQITTDTALQQAPNFNPNSAQMLQSKLTFTPEWKIQIKKWFFEMQTPLSYLRNQFRNVNRKQLFNQYFPEPNATVGYKLNKQNYFSVSIKYENDFGGFFSRVPFLLLNNFRSVSAGIDSLLPQEKNLIAETGYSYTSLMEDFNLRLNYSSSWQHLNYNTAFSFSELLQTTHTVAASNRAWQQKADLQSMKILTNWQTTLKFKMQLSDFRFVQIQNFINTQFRIAQAGGSFNLSVRKIKNTVLTANTELQNIYTAQKGLQLQKNSTIHSGNLSITVFLKKRKWAIENSHRTVQISGQSTAFYYQPNVTVSYFAKKQTFELAATNLNNSKTFYNLQAFQNIILQTAYQLRPLEVLLRYSVRF
ncbi:MAG: hypothetical protein ACK4E8_05445 [Lacibacter sp.]